MKSIRYAILLSLVIVFTGALLAQPRYGVVAGRILLETNDPAVGAAVLLSNTQLGASADSNGRFTIPHVPPGSYQVEVRLVGYDQETDDSVVVIAGDTALIEIRMQQRVVEMGQVDVTASRIRKAEDSRLSLTTITPRESKYLPGAAEDVLRSLQSLPGVASANDYSAQLIIRGSGPDQNLIMIDGFEVLNPYRLYGFVSMFNPETVSDISLQTGGFAAQYGDRLSAVLDVRNREGRSDLSYGGKANLSLTNANIIMEGKLPFDASWIVSARRTYYDLILGPVLKSAKIAQGDVALPNFRDVQAKLAVPISAEHKILVNAITSRDGVQFMAGEERDRPDSVVVNDESYNSLIGATWQFNPSPDVLTLTQLSWYRNNGTGFFDATLVDPSQNTGEIGRADTLGIRYVNFGVNYDYIYTKTSFAQKLLYNRAGNSIEVGYGIDGLRTDYIRSFTVDKVLRDLIVSRGSIVPTDITATVTYKRYNIYAQDRLTLSDRFYIKPGVRFDLYPNLYRHLYISPRVSISYGFDNLSTIRAAYGTYYQSPGMEKQLARPRLDFTDEYFSTITAEKATHYIIGFERMVTPEWQFKMETYFKQFSENVVPEKHTGTVWYAQRTGGDIFSRDGWTTPVRVHGDSLSSRPVNDGTGKAYGVEFMFQKIQSQTGERFNGWVSYALSFADRERDGVTSPFLFDQRHAINIVGDYRFAERWDLGFNFTLRSGKPYTQAKHVKPRVVMQRANGVDVPVVQVDGKGKVILDVEYEQETYSGRFNLYHTLDLRVTTYPRWWGLRWSLYLDVTNILNRKNQQQIDYYIDENGSLKERAFNGLPIFPALGMSVIF